MCLKKLDIATLNIQTFFSIMESGPKSFIKKHMNHAMASCLTESMNYKRENVTVVLDRNNYEAHK